MIKFSVYRNALAVCVGAFLAASPAHAGVIVNGNFETGSLSSWTSTGNVGIAGVPFFGEGMTAANGNYFAVFNGGNGAANGILSQSFTAIAGTQYSLSFDYGSNGGSVQKITAAIKDSLGNALASQLTSSTGIQGPLATFGFSFYSATSQTLTLSFADFAGNPTNSTDGALDNVSVNAVPEPSSLAVLALGALFCVAGLRFQSSRASRA